MPSQQKGFSVMISDSKRIFPAFVSITATERSEKIPYSYAVLDRTKILIGYP